MKKDCDKKILKMIFGPIYMPTENNGLVDISSHRKDILFHVNSVLRKQTEPVGQFLFRGQKKNELRKALIKKDETFDECTLYNHLFYFGLKAKWYYSSSGPINYNKTHVVGMASEDELFDYVNAELKKIKNESFVTDNKDLLCFFNKSENRMVFTNIIKDNPLFYRYYNFFLHTLGKRQTRPSSFLSSSKSYKKAEEFAIDEYNTDKKEDSIVIASTLPKGKINGEHAQKAFKSMIEGHNKIEKQLIQYKLPVFDGKWVYEQQQEIVLAYGMFPQHIWGVFDLTERKTIVNPYMFEPQNHNRQCLSFNIDQTDFDERIKEETNYWNGFYCDSEGLYPLIFN